MVSFAHLCTVKSTIVRAKRNYTGMWHWSGIMEECNQCNDNGHSRTGVCVSVQRRHAGCGLRVKVSTGMRNASRPNTYQNTRE